MSKQSGKKNLITRLGEEIASGGIKVTIEEAQPAPKKKGKK